MKITHTLTAAAIAGLLSIGSFAGIAMAQDVDGAADIRAQIEALNCDSLLDADVRGKLVTSIDDLIASVPTNSADLADALALRGLLAVKISALEADCDDEPTTVVPTPTPTPTSTTPAVRFENCDEVRAANAAPLTRSSVDYRPELDSDNDGIACEDDEPQVERVPQGGVETGGR